jgi:HEAT repeat protein
MGRQSLFCVLLLTAGMSVSGSAQDQPYDVAAVKGIDAFGGSAAARDLLRKNGFVVADPAFRQIFEPYIASPTIEGPSAASPRGRSLPSFVTTDSAWHTYHVLLEEGVKQLEELQSTRLLEFSRELLAATGTEKDSGELTFFASVGLALQDEAHRQSLPPEEKCLVDGLRTGSEPLSVPIGFPLAPQQFRAQSFYAQSSKLSEYFAARQWYASVVFRLSNPRETRLAVSLACAIVGRPQLLTLWHQLSDPFDAFLAPAEDGTVQDYFNAAQAVRGTAAGARPVTDAQIQEIEKKLQQRLALPRVSDQLLGPAQYLDYGRQTRGFRLLPPRRLPCSVCFHNTVDPKIRGRQYPSGLDFLAASPVLRSPAATRAVQNQFGQDVSDLILKAECGPMPDSLHGEAMHLLATLQKPLPPEAPAPLRTEAWSDLQLWTQLGAWAEQRHTWALHTKLSASVLGIIRPPHGMVAPYPEFFSGLAALTRRTAAAFENAGFAQKFEVESVARQLLELLTLSHKLSRATDEKDYEKMSAGLEQLGAFKNRYYEKHRAELEKTGPRDAWQQLEKDLEALARRCATGGQASESDTATLRKFFDCRQNIARLLNDFAPVCDRLAELAQKSASGQPLTEDDARWIENYGVTLAGFHFYYGNSYEVPQDDFPIVTRVFSNPLTDSMLYAGLARPQALYIIIPDGKALQLYRGAVLTYREFVRPNDQLLDDESWRELIAKGQTPPAPPFTLRFYAETTVAELLKKLRAETHNEEANLGQTEELLWQIGSRATAQDLPALFDMMTHTKGAEGRWDIVDGLAEIIGRLPWESRQKQLLELLGSPDIMLAKAVARILIEHPAAIDQTLLTTGYAQQPPRQRRLVCAIIGRLPQPTEATRRTLSLALHDQDAGVRWQAVMAIGQARCTDVPSCSALAEALNDKNQFVGCAAAWSLARMRSTNSAPLLFAKLKTVLSSTNLPIEALEKQSWEIRQDFNGDGNHAIRVLDPDHLEINMFVHADVTANMRRMAAMRLPPQPFRLSMPNYDLAAGLIEALGNLKYAPAAAELFKLSGTDYEPLATDALAKLAPDRLTDQLLATATNKQVDSYLREKAMVTLGSISATNRVRDLVPLLDDTAPIVYDRPLPGPEWRVCDRAAVTISTLLRWESPMEVRYMRPEQREQLMTRVRGWAGQDH